MVVYTPLTWRALPIPPTYPPTRFILEEPMAEEKKPKIDLKARLGRTAPGGAATGIPAPVVPPSAAGAIPPPAVGPSGGVIPPPVVGPSGVPAPTGVPIPPFAAASQPEQPAQPAVDPSDPFAAAAAAPAAQVQPAEIKLDIGDDLIRAQKKAGGMRTVIVAGLVGVVTLGIGYTIGSQSEQSAGAQIAVRGAEELIGDIEQSQERIKELNEKIDAAIASIKERKFPETFAADLGGISIPFGPDQLAGRNIGRFPGPTLNLLLGYTSQVQALNERKDALRSLFTGQKAAITEALSSVDDPKIKFNIIVQRDPDKGPLAILAPVNGEDAWSAKAETWPASYKISTGKELVDVERWMGRGDVISTNKVVGLPVEPGSIAQAFPNDVVMRIQSELMKTGTILAGRTGGLPDEDEAGVLSRGEMLIEQLKKIGAAQ